MSRIEDVFKRITGAAADPRPAPALERYTPERTSRVEENRVTTFIAPGPHPVEAKPPRQKAPTPPAPSTPAAIPLPTQHTLVHHAHQSDGAHEEQAASEEKLINFEHVFNYAGFLAHSILRHKLLAMGTFAFAFALTVAGTIIMPKTYHVGTKLLAQRNAVMPALSNPGRQVPWDADAPTRAAAETILRRDNLIALIQKTDLMREWERTRAPVLKFKDWVMKRVTRYEPTPEEKLDGMIGQLEAKIKVVAGPVGDGTVSIDLDWRDPEMAFKLVEEAQKAFLAARQKAETDAITEAITILDDYSESLTEKINGSLTELERTQKSLGRSPGAARAVLAQAGRPSAPAATEVVPSLISSLGLPQFDGSADLNARINDLKTVITSKRQELARLEESRDRQISEQQAELARLMTIFTPTHPSVIGAQQRMAALSQPIPQVLTLRNEVEDLEREQGKLTGQAADLQIKAELAKRSAAAAAAWESAGPTTTSAPEVLAPDPATVQTQDTADEFATVQIRTQLTQLQSVLERTYGAKIELAVAQSAFKYRYTVIRPAQVPREPVKPNLRLVVGAGFFGSLVLALGAAAGSDLLGNRILETWQIERHLGLPVLGRLETV